MRNHTGRGARLWRGRAARGRSVAVVLAIVGEGLLTYGRAGATASTVDIPLFSISKSENKNQVQYAVHVDEHCAPVSDAPVSAYWNMRELGPTRTEPLLARELPAYGAASQAILERDADGGKIRIVLRAMPSRPIVVAVSRATGNTCQASAMVTIAGGPARLFDVYAKLLMPFGVEYLLVRGWSLDGARVVTERLKK